MEHVVDERELRVEVQRRRQRVVGEAVEAGATARAAARRRARRAGRGQSAPRRSSSTRPLIASSRRPGRRPRSVAPSLREPAGPGERAAAEPPRSGAGSALPARRRAQRPGACRSRRSSSSAPWPESATVTCCAASSREREEAERREVGERLVQVTRRAPRARPVVVNESSSSWCSVPKSSATSARRRARCPRRPRRTRPRRSSPGSLMCRAISATIRLESSPPLSIAPSGTSLIRRSRTDSSSPSSSRSAYSVRRQRRVGRRRCG